MIAEIAINPRQYFELEKIALGVYAPLAGFMNENEFKTVVDQMRLPNREVFPLPVVLDISLEQLESIRGRECVALRFKGDVVGEIRVQSFYTCKKTEITKKIYGTSDPRHPGVAHFYKMGEWFLGGTVRLIHRVPFEFSDYDLTPSETRTYFSDQGWKTVAGFQTRNVPHLAHEHLQRMALKEVDGLFIQPLVGRKKCGDYNPRAILSSYEILIETYLPKNRVLLGVLSAAMRYAGPREAIFHAIIRRNYGCTHFVIGRDHAGVGNYYGKYEAQELARQFEGELGINILYYPGPFFCIICSGIVTEQTCPHEKTDPSFIDPISGTAIREALISGDPKIAEKYLRPAVLERIRGIPLFIEEDQE